MLWVAGYKPSLVFKIVDGAVKDLTAEQTLRMEEVKAETGKKERERADGDIVAIGEASRKRGGAANVGVGKAGWEAYGW